MVALIEPDGRLLFANAAFEGVLGLSRRSVLRSSLYDLFVDATTLRHTLAAVSRNEVSTSRFEALLRRPSPAYAEPLPVQVIVNQSDRRRRDRHRAGGSRAADAAGPRGARARAGAGRPRS